MPSFYLGTQELLELLHDTNQLYQLNQPIAWDQSHMSVDLEAVSPITCQSHVHGAWKALQTLDSSPVAWGQSQESFDLDTDFLYRSLFTYYGWKTHCNMLTSVSRSHWMP
jgi:hypothetical protein